MHTQLRDSKLERNRILYKIKDIENDSVAKLKELNNIQKEYDDNIIKKNSELNRFQKILKAIGL